MLLGLMVSINCSCLALLLSNGSMEGGHCLRSSLESALSSHWIGEGESPKVTEPTGGSQSRVNTSHPC